MLQNEKGFTLIEITVVLFIMSMMFFFAVPKFDSGIFSDKKRKSFNFICGKIEDLKYRAVEEQKDFALIFDIDGNRIKAVDEEGNSSEEYRLPSYLSITDIEFSEDKKISSGIAKIFFFKKGYCTKAIIHLQDDDGKKFSFAAKPFLRKVKFAEEYLSL